MNDATPVAGTEPEGGLAPIIRADGEGERLSFFGGGLMTMKATSKETNGAFLLFDDRMVGGKATPLHVHPDEDETFYVLEGTLVVHFAGTEHPVGPGGVVMFPRGVPHAFVVTSQAARILTLLTPGSAEPFYREASSPAAPDADPAGPVDFEKVRQAAEKTGRVRLLGPPPFAR